ncbi:hypothetical protein AGMMS50212_07080 [Spirochaetia bacterium]|nr:hypothetical protein AGMMS50212_07030 [Spirochaetia bacterium]GHV83368.1 hypothetical protein AGMMS50212_07080 [Spirochaetia bacterium]
MSDTALLLKEVEGLPSNYMAEILDFVGYLKHKAPAVRKASTAATEQDFDKTYAEIRQPSALEQATSIFPELRVFTQEEAMVYSDSLLTLFKKTGRKIF